MDAFSLALSIGTMPLTKKSNFILSFTVGFFHFFMPILGHILGISFISHFHINSHFISAIIFSYIALQMIKEMNEEEKPNFKFEFGSIIIFALGVSLDSFGVGFTLNESIIISASIFAIFSAIFTFLGLSLGNLLSKLIGRAATVLGTCIMIFLAIINFVNFCSFN